MSDFPPVNTDDIDHLDLLGKQIERLENLRAGLEMQLPAQMHLDQLKNVLPEIYLRLRWIHTQIAGHDLWEGHPKLPWE